MSKVNSPLKFHGGKAPLADRIVALFPPKQTPEHPDGYLNYCETFGGGLSVMLANDPEGISEVANDKNCLLMNFWGCLAYPPGFESLRRKAEAAPFSQALWEVSAELVESLSRRETLAGLSAAQQEQAAFAFFVCCRQSLAGRMKAFAPLSKTRVRRGMNEQASAWLTAIECLPEVHARLKRVALLCDNFDKVIISQDGPQTLFYVDAPYPSETRAAKDVYQHEMTNVQHSQLLSLLATIDGRFLLSGYACPLYDKTAELCGWERHDFDLPNNAAGGKEKRRMTESIWRNYRQDGSRIDPVPRSTGA